MYIRDIFLLSSTTKKPLLTSLRTAGDMMGMPGAKAPPGRQGLFEEGGFRA